VTTFLLIFHLFIALVVIGLVLLQRSEGGALGIGGGPGATMSSRGAASGLARMTTIAIIAFFGTSIALTLVATQGEGPSSVLQLEEEEEPEQTPEPGRLPELDLGEPQAESVTGTEAQDTEQVPQTSEDDGSANGEDGSQPNEDDTPQ
jgi:preprotein translocase subunit SecG